MPIVVYKLFARQDAGRTYQHCILWAILPVQMCLWAFI